MKIKIWKRSALDRDLWRTIVGRTETLFGQTKEVNGLWRFKTNEELDELIKRKKKQVQSMTVLLKM